MQESSLPSLNSSAKRSSGTSSRAQRSSQWRSSREPESGSLIGGAAGPGTKSEGKIDLSPISEIRPPESTFAIGFAGEIQIAGAYGIRMQRRPFQFLAMRACQVPGPAWLSL